MEERTKDGGEIRGREEEAQGVGYPAEGNPFKAPQEGLRNVFCASKTGLSVKRVLNSKEGKSNRHS